MTAVLAIDPRRASLFYRGGMRKRVVGLLTIGYSVVIGLMTLGPQPSTPTTQDWARLVIGFVDRHIAASFDYADLEFIGNIALFFPLGLLLILFLGRGRWWVVVLIGIAATCGIEFVQHFIPTRVPDVRDLIANSTGALVGVLVGLPFARTRHRDPRPATGGQPAVG
jgi:glycopeptide antibiotics resistance protein